MTTPIPAQQLEEVLAIRENANQETMAYLRECRAFDAAAGDFFRDNAETLRRALAALKAVERAIKADTIAYSRPPMRAVTGIAVDDDRLTPLIGTRVLIIPADAVEVSRG